MSDFLCNAKFSKLCCYKHWTLESAYSFQIHSCKKAMLKERDGFCTSSWCKTEIYVPFLERKLRVGQLGGLRTHTLVLVEFYCQQNSTSIRCVSKCYLVYSLYTLHAVHCLNVDLNCSKRSHF